MNTAKTPIQDSTKRYANAVSYTRGGCYSSPKLNAQGVALHTPVTTTQASAITGFRTVLNHRATVQ
jgi:hypothetical protein